MHALYIATLQQLVRMCCRQTARAVQSSWRHQSALYVVHFPRCSHAAAARCSHSPQFIVCSKRFSSEVMYALIDMCCVQYRDPSLAYLWPLTEPGAQDQSTATQDLAQQTSHAHAADPDEAMRSRCGPPCPPCKAAVQQEKHQRRPAALKLKGRQSPSTRATQQASAHSGSADLHHSDPGSASDDSIHTAHFSDEGELSDTDTSATSIQNLSAERKDTKQGAVVLYHGPNSKQLAASRVASKPPPGPRPQLGDVLLEAIHSDDVQRSKATGAFEEPLPRDKWRCIMRQKSADGCGPLVAAITFSIMHCDFCIGVRKHSSS